MFAQSCRLVHHEVVGLSLGELLPAIVDSSLDHSDNLERVDQPQKRDEESIDHEHNRFFLDYTELILEDVVKGDPLDQ
jgi:hypothetical protein